MKNTILTVFLTLNCLIGFSQSKSMWMEPKKCMYRATETTCVIKVNNCYRKVFTGTEKLFYIEQNPKNILLWRRVPITNVSRLKCK